MADLTAEMLREFLHYEPETGVFRWLEWNHRRRSDLTAGSLNKCGYCAIKIGSESFLAHRLAWLWMTGAWPREDIDHINLDRSDNRFANLREASRSQNRANTRPQKRNKGLKGVTWHSQQSKIMAQIMVHHKRKFLGFFDTQEKAHAAYCEAAKKYFGEFARAV